MLYIITHDLHLSHSKGLGNLGLQNFHQRTLSASSSSTAKVICFAAAFIVPTLGIPPILLGAVAASTGTVTASESYLENAVYYSLCKLLFHLKGTHITEIITQQDK